MPVAKVTEDICAIGASDRDGKKLFERLFPIPEGVAYNSYLILDEKTAVLDGAAKEVEDEYFVNLESALNGRTLDYIVLNHLEPCLLYTSYLLRLTSAQTFYLRC